MSSIKHSINQIRGLRPSISHYFLMNLENFVEKNNLNYFKEMKTLYKYKELVEVTGDFEKYGKVISTARGLYVESKNALILLDLTIDDLAGLYLHIEFFYNSEISITELEKTIFKDLLDHECKEVITRIDWQFKTKDYIDSISLYEINKTVIYDEAYPYIKELADKCKEKYLNIKGSVDKYIQEFIDSDETILIMIGPAGTGKNQGPMGGAGEAGGRCAPARRGCRGPGAAL